MNELDICLKRLSDIVHSAGFVTESEFFSSKKNRINLYANTPNSFLSINKKGVPLFPTKDQFGNSSFSVLKRSLHLAQKMNESSIMFKLEEEIENLNKIKMTKKEKLITTQVRDLGSLGEF